MTISDEQLLEYDLQGLIPGPKEDETSFLDRVNYCLEIKNILRSHISKEIEINSRNYLKEVYPMTLKSYALAPDWIPIVFDNHQLYLWHGGSAWIFQLEEASPLSAFIQMRKELKDKNHCGLFLDRNEILAHEIAHVGRMAFEEPKYEELLAYSSSKSKWRKLSGGLIKNSKESALFVLTLFLIILLDLFLLMTQDFKFYATASLFKLIPVAMIIFATIRLYYTQKNFKKCFKNLSKCLKKDYVAPFIYRLTDREIDLFGKYSEKEIKDYFNADESLRGRLLKLYFIKS